VREEVECREVEVPFKDKRVRDQQSSGCLGTAATNVRSLANEKRGGNGVVQGGNWYMRAASTEPETEKKWYVNVVFAR